MIRCPLRSTVSLRCSRSDSQALIFETQPCVDLILVLLVRGHLLLTRDKSVALYPMGLAFNLGPLLYGVKLALLQRLLAMSGVVVERGSGIVMRCLPGRICWSMSGGTDRLGPPAPGCP